jgi:hypothetical protein
MHLQIQLKIIHPDNLLLSRREPPKYTYFKKVCPHTPVKIKIPQPQLSANLVNVTPDTITLYPRNKYCSPRKFKRLEKKITRQEQRLKKKDKQLNRVKNKTLSRNECFRDMCTIFEGEKLMFFKMQATHQDQHCQYTNEEKDFALRLFYQSARAYKYMRTKFTLPCTSLIYKWNGMLRLQPGVCNEVLEKIALKTESMTPDETECIITLDEMTKRSGLYIIECMI